MTSVVINGETYVKQEGKQETVDAIVSSVLKVKNMGKGLVLITIDDEPTARLHINKGCVGSLTFTRVKQVNISR